jgi:hypothetical protein
MTRLPVASTSAAMLKTALICSRNSQPMVGIVR